MGIEKGLAQQAVMEPLSDIMRRTARVFRIDLLSHGNQKKQDRILWALQGDSSMGRLSSRPTRTGTSPSLTRHLRSPSHLVHDDLLDALAYVDQMAIVPYGVGGDYDDDYEPLDIIAGY